jgi:DNA-binding transcriptional ArsR family regulator
MAGAKRDSDMTTEFEPAARMLVSDPKQLRALADPLRVRILHILADRAATNQQLAAALGQSQAKVLHHVRYLLDAGLILLVDQQIRGGNVEKYYRAKARLHSFRPEPSDSPEHAGPVSVALLESATQELAASLAQWPDQTLYWETRRGRLTPERTAEFSERLQELIAEYWGELDSPPVDEPGGVHMAFATTTYRYPDSI